MGALLRAAWRLGALAAVLWLVRQHHARLRVDADRPVEVAEARAFFPGARRLLADPSWRRGLHVLDGSGRAVGYVVRTAPATDDIVGYRGPADVLIALTPEYVVVGVSLRRSADTDAHVADVRDHPSFLKTWNGMAWDRAGRLDLEEAGVEGVSGATMTSLAVAESVGRRLREGPPPPRPFRPGVRDLGAAAVLAGGLALSFTGLRRRAWIRRPFQVAAILYLGFASGDLLTQALCAGWAASRVPWEAAPGLALLGAAAVLVPWATGRAVYCAQICPYGALQEMAGRLSPWRLRVPPALARGLRRAPPLVLGLVLAVAMLDVPFDLGAIEPFEAFLLAGAGAGSLGLAAAGLAASAVVPQAYCRYGCPTGALLEFVRARGRADRLGARDLGAAAMAAGAALLAWGHGAVWEALREAVR
jgi:hypothetical protein